MALEENNLGLDDFLEPSEDFLGEPEFPKPEEGFETKPALARKAAKKRRLREFSGEETGSSGGTEAASQAVSEPAAQDKTQVEIKSIKFPDLEKTVSQAGLLSADMFHHIPVQVKVVLGTAQINLKEVVELSEGSIVSLEKLVGEPLDLVINEQVIAQGEVIVVDGSYGLRITKIINKK